MNNKLIITDFDKWQRVNFTNEHLIGTNRSFFDGEVAEYISRKCNVIGYMLNPLATYNKQSLIARPLQVFENEIDSFIDEYKNKQLFLYTITFYPNYYIGRMLDKVGNIHVLDELRLYREKVYWIIRFTALD